MKAEIQSEATSLRDAWTSGAARRDLGPRKYRT